jgi:run domain Beclin-1 interacting cysteine-rich containing protein
LLKKKGERKKIYIYFNSEYSFSLQQTLLTLSSYIYDQPHTYSLQDLVKVKKKDLFHIIKFFALLFLQTKLREFQRILEPIVANLREHVLSCSLCSAKGFICEICNNEKSIIFPFNIETTSVCPGLLFS